MGGPTTLCIIVVSASLSGVVRAGALLEEQQAYEYKTSCRVSTPSVHGGFTVHVPEEIDVKSIRTSLGLTQPEFSSR